MLKITIRPAAGAVSTELYISAGLLAGVVLKDFVGQWKGKTVLIADRAVKDLYASSLARRLCAELLTIEADEIIKTRETAAFLMDELFKMGAGRDTLLIAMGGGATTDLTGFVASVYMRGVPLILAPTTLLAAVDASIGGKTAINAPFGKNLIGTVYHPKAIFIDSDTLQTLPEKEWFNGLAEILKIGLIADPSILDLAWNNEKNPALMIQAIQNKIAIIEQDPLERGLRRILNFGHTIGHALETVSHYEMPHGAAVALGCLAESHLSMRLGYLPKSGFDEIRSMFGRFSLRLPKTSTRSKLLQAMAHDKKNALGAIRFVLIDKIGHAIPFDGNYCRPVDQGELESTLVWMESSF